MEPSKDTVNGARSEQEKRTGGVPGEMPAIARPEILDLVNYKRHEDGSISVTMPRHGGIVHIIDKANQETKNLGISLACEPHTQEMLNALATRYGATGVYAEPGKVFDIKIHPELRVRSLEHQTKALAEQGRVPVPLEALFLAGMCVHVESKGKESLFKPDQVRGAASGAALWPYNGSICIERATNGASPHIVIASMRADTAR